MSFTTQITSPLSGVEHHIVFFAPADDSGGPSPVVALQIPEAGRPLIRRAWREAQARSARLIILCDTEDQASAIAARAAASLPHHRRVSLERALAGGWGALQ